MIRTSRWHLAADLAADLTAEIGKVQPAERAGDRRERPSQSEFQKISGSCVTNGRFFGPLGGEGGIRPPHPPARERYPHGPAPTSAPRRSAHGDHRDRPGRPADGAQTVAAEQRARPRVPRLRDLLRRTRDAKAQPPETRVQWQHGDTLSTRLLHAALVAALISGPLAVCWVAVATSARQPESVAQRRGSRQHLRWATLRSRRPRPSDVVLTWLTASATDKAALQALVVEQLPTTLDLPEKRPAAPTQMWVGAVDQRSPGRYRVVVATVGGAAGRPAYFAVPVRVDGGVAAALSLPGRTRPPAALDADSNGLPAMIAVSTDDPAFQTAAGYVTAYLTGSAEIDRWTGSRRPRSQRSLRAPAAPSGSTVSRRSPREAPTTRAAVVATATCQTAGRPSSDHPVRAGPPGPRRSMGSHRRGSRAPPRPHGAYPPPRHPVRHHPSSPR